MVGPNKQKRIATLRLLTPKTVYSVPHWYYISEIEWTRRPVSQIQLVKTVHKKRVIFQLIQSICTINPLTNPFHGIACIMCNVCIQKTILLQFNIEQEVLINSIRFYSPHFHVSKATEKKMPCNILLFSIERHKHFIFDHLSFICANTQFGWIRFGTYDVCVCVCVDVDTVVKCLVWKKKQSAKKCTKVNRIEIKKMEFERKNVT